MTPPCDPHHTNRSWFIRMCQMKITRCICRFFFVRLSNRKWRQIGWKRGGSEGRRLNWTLTKTQPLGIYCNMNGNESGGGKESTNGGNLWQCDKKGGKRKIETEREEKIEKRKRERGSGVRTKEKDIQNRLEEKRIAIKLTN